MTTEAGADRPDLLTGQQVHAVVAIPSDGVDTFSAESARLADDIASISAWWQGQDPTRIPRFDQATFGTTTCTDISFVRLASSGATYTASGASGAFQRVSSELGLGGLGSTYKKYLVYYAGPSVQANVCGTGGGDFGSGRSYAIIWLRECTDVPSDTVAAHELLHAFGALPDGARHPCPPTGGGSGHPCDSPSDILYPYASGGPLSSLVLDVNHDDYYAHPDSDPWVDIQDSHWLHRLDLGQVALAVSLSGGPGTITSDVPGVDCAATCTTPVGPGRRATADGGARRERSLHPLERLLYGQFGLRAEAGASRERNCGLRAAAHPAPPLRRRQGSHRMRPGVRPDGSRR